MRREPWRRPLALLIACAVCVVMAGALASSSGHPTRALVLVGCGATVALAAAFYGTWREHQ